MGYFFTIFSCGLWVGSLRLWVDYYKLLYALRRSLMPSVELLHHKKASQKLGVERKSWTKGAN